MEEDFIIIPVLAIDNLVTRNRRRLPAAELPALAALLVGKPAIANHNTYNVAGEWATVTKAWVQTIRPGDDLYPADLSEVDRAVVAAEGYQVVMLELSVTPDCPYLDDFDVGLKRRVSITFIYSRLVCPDCNCGVQDMWHPKCPNLPYELPHIEYAGVTDAWEVSLVVVPAVRAASVLV